VADLTTVRILDGRDVVATHERCWDRGRQLEDPTHIAALTESKRAARKHRGMNRLTQASPSCQAFLELAAARGVNLGSMTSHLLTLLDAHGADDFEEAMVEVLERDRIHVGAVRHVLDRNRTARGKPPPVTTRIGPEKHAHLVVTPHALGSYDRMTQEDNNDDE
jgi:hypothetical protein